ncbi:MAG TPA: cytochrome P450 [Actinobacteria bacterium]|nr:cytochrome P450 [Actinomycetota bacterium]
MVERTPRDELVDLDALSVDPHPIFERLRTLGEAVWAERLGVWLVAGYEACRRVLGDPTTFTVEADDNILEATIGRMMLSVDGEPHKRYRRPFAKPLHLPALRAAGMEATVREIAGELIDGFAGDRKADLRAAYARPLAMRVVVAHLGLPWDERLFGIFDAVAAAFANQAGDPEVAASGRRAFAEFADLVAEAPDDAPFRRMSRFAEPPLDAAEIASNVAITVFGGFETTTATIVNALWAIGDRDLWDLVAGESPPWSRIVEETLRWESPVQTATRHVTVDVEFGGARLRAGDRLWCLLGAANRDPAAFPEPDRFRLDRPPMPKILSFASGPHLCIGAPLARMEGAVALEVLFDRLPGLRLLDAGRPVGHEFRSLAQLPATW